MDELPTFWHTLERRDKDGKLINFAQVTIPTDNEQYAEHTRKLLVEWANAEYPRRKPLWAKSVKPLICAGEPRLLCILFFSYFRSVILWV